MGVLAYFLVLCWAFSSSSIVHSAHRAAFGTYYPGNTYDVTKFGAVGNGKTYDTNAFESAWEAACKRRSGNTKIIVPSKKTFLVSPIEFKGPCKSRSITFEILGTILAPSKSTWKYVGTDQWLYFHKVDGLSVVGNGKGLIDGQGESWWGHRSDDNSRPSAIRFSHCNNLKINGLRHKSSQKNHISLNECHHADVSNLRITAPQDSPNTDGIDISDSTNLRIHDSVMETGDDCIAINGGTSNVNISGIACGPGHGISVGSLGKNGKYDTVEAIHVSDCSFTGTKNGVRIKTWQGGSGYARNISFSNINFNAADNPIVIDQYYCPHKKCPNKGSAVKISDVRYTGLRGTSTCKKGVINFNCSQTVPCTHITLADVNVKPANPHIPVSAHCINAHGRAHVSDPALNCLKN